jgi:glutamine amidotransferase
MLTIIDYDGGNLRSVQRACDAVGLRSAVTQSATDVLAAERVIFPGVGHAQGVLESLERTGLGEVLRTVVERGTPVLGICVGCQVILDRSEEATMPALGLIPGETVRFERASGIKVPHIGWNAVRPTQAHPLLQGIAPGDEFYFVHSYFPRPRDAKHVFATTRYGAEFCCAVGDKNLFATQFHPEKSGRFGLELLQRFARWDGTVPEGPSRAE